MATIDKYKHKLLGFINCPSDFDIVYNSPVREIAIYELEQDIPNDENDFDGKKGDILIGGGSGEVSVLRLSMPACIHFFFNDWDAFENYDELFKAFWQPTISFKLCNGFRKLGWNPDLDIEFWLAKHICAYLIKHLDMFSNFDSEQITYEKRLFDYQQSV